MRKTTVSPCNLPDNGGRTRKIVSSNGPTSSKCFMPRYVRRCAFSIAWSVCILFMDACESNSTDSLVRNDLTKALEKANWIPLAFPDSSFAPGSVVTIEPGDKQKKVKYLGTLNAELCNIPSKYLQESTAYSPALSTQTQYVAGIGLAAAIYGVTVDANATGNWLSYMKIDDQGAHNLDAFSLITWIAGNKNQINAECLKKLQAPNAYLINRAFAINKAIISFKDAAGANVAATAPQLLKKVIGVSADANAAWNENGELEISKPTFVAVQGLRNLTGNIEVLGEGNRTDSNATAISAVLQEQGESVLSVPK